MDKKEYTLPQDIKDLFEESYVLRGACEVFKDSIFGSYKKTIKAHREAMKLERRAWGMIYELYPEIKGKGMTYLYIPQILVSKEDKQCIK